MPGKFTTGQLLRTVSRHRALVLALAMRDLQARYVGTLGGLLWALAHPLAVVVVFYLVFAVGFRSQGPADTPFILWFVAGLVPWFFFSDALQAITFSVTRNSHLVKKTIFPTEILPLVHLVSGLIPHVFFLAVLTALMLFFHVPLLAERLLFLYFLLCMGVLLLGLGWLLAALQVFYRDIGQALTIVLNLWFWSTPIVWSAEIMPPSIASWLVYNPMFYIVNGYRDTLIAQTVTWPPLDQTLVFWAGNLLLLGLGCLIFHRLKPEFADAL
ncbi:ABC transporter permease [Pseudomonas turukhanskensis]|uniref:Transport permease protein n=1 Tax=Pseudomonas turukhanskensis TaxID=1806536 RepID=A0A9W6K4S2_9PSED|nr:ABC transporter permease [Pseudomonas turukhanskensis]GLK87740.1 transport permease protein [Pseudomonas turukhanskensis]